jgi:metallo-beta-lactamase family protein
MIQDGHTPLENYKLNSKLLQKIRPQEIDYIIIGHNHLDHVGLIPALYARGKCNAKIIVPKKSTCILKEMWLDAAYINQRDVELINLKDKNYEPFYNEDIVMKALNYVQEIQSDEMVNISEELAIRYRNAGHILLSKQAEVYINGGSHTRKILFTSDLGNLATQESRVFVEDFQAIPTSNIVIGECTYSSRSGKEITKKTLEKDMQKIKAAIEQYCVDRNNRVLIPTFSLDRMPYILWILYTLFGKDENFKVPILVDSPLANRLLDCYSSILEDEKKEKFDEMMSWKNIKRVITPEDSKAAIADRGAKVICSSSGMLTAGRSVKWTQSILPNENDLIMFVGYAGEDTLAYKIKHEKEQKTININGKPIKNKAQIIDLLSFSSHMQRKDLINYYKGINCDKIYLVHSDKNKIEFKQDLEKAINDCLKSTRVVAVNKGTKISI